MQEHYRQVRGMLYGIASLSSLVFLALAADRCAYYGVHCHGWNISAIISSALVLIVSIVLAVCCTRCAEINTQYEFVCAVLLLVLWSVTCGVTMGFSSHFLSGTVAVRNSFLWFLEIILFSLVLWSLVAGEFRYSKPDSNEAAPRQMPRSADHEDGIPEEAMMSEEPSGDPEWKAENLTTQV